jgi:hypothetical protein
MTIASLLLMASKGGGFGWKKGAAFSSRRLIQVFATPEPEGVANLFNP